MLRFTVDFAPDELTQEKAQSFNSVSDMVSRVLGAARRGSTIARGPGSRAVRPLRVAFGGAAVGTGARVPVE